MIGRAPMLARLAEFSALYIPLPGLLCLTPQLPALPVLWLIFTLGPGGYFHRGSLALFGFG